MRPKRVTFVISSLASGGAERILIWLANQWQKKGRQVTILTLCGPETPISYKVDPTVRLVKLGISENSQHSLQGLINNLKRLPVLRHEINKRRPELVVSFMDRTNISVLLALLGCRVPVIVAEHTNPDFLQGKVWHLLRRVTYPLADSVVVLTERTKEKLPFVRSRILVIPNPVTVSADTTSSDPLSVARPTLVALGRLVELKRFDLLIRTFAETRTSHPDWSLVILGEGPERAGLEALVAELELVDAVKLPGHVDTPEQVLRQCDLFVLTSRFEGFPVALCEAMACGLPVIATDCPTGPREIIRDGVDGILVPNEDNEALSAAINRLMSDTELRSQLARKATEVRERFSPERILSLWEAAITKQS